jgi:adenylate cyclase
MASNLPLLLVGSYRDDEAPDLPERLPGTQVHKLSRLDEPSIQELSVSILGETGRQRQIVDLLQRETEGIPFFLVEVVRALAENAGELSQISQRLLPERILAGGIEQIIERRLNRVSEEARGLLQMAAVIGRDLDLPVLQALSSTTDLDSWLTLCANAAILEVQENRWRFTHDKLREHLLEELSESERPILHRRAAKTIEKISPDPSKQAAILAHLWRVAGDENKELHFSEMAGQQELANSIYVEGIRFLQRALELLLKQDDTLERAEHELRLQLLLGPALMNYYGHNHPIVAETYARAAKLGQGTQQIDTVFRVLFGLCMNAFVGGNLGSATVIVKQLFDTTERSGSSLHRLESYHAAWSTATWQGATRNAIDYFEEGIPIYERAQHQQECISLHGHDTGVCGWALATINLWLFGYPERALAQSNNAYELSLEVNHPFSQSFGLFAPSILGLLAGNVSQLEQWTDEFLNYSFKNNYNFFMTLSGITHGGYLARKGHFQKAIQQMVKATEVMHKARTYSPRPLLVSTFMEVYRMAGQIDEGIQLFHKESEEHPIAGERMMEPEIRRLHGELLLAKKDSQQAEQEFQLALKIARQQEAKSLELRAGMSLARLWQSQLKTREAHQMLSEIYNWFTEGFDTPDLREAKILLETVS